jgi:hypothetical protein
MSPSPWRSSLVSDMTFTPGEFRKALGVFPTGVAIVTARVRWGASGDDGEFIQLSLTGAPASVVLCRTHGAELLGLAGSKLMGHQRPWRHTGQPVNAVRPIGERQVVGLRAYYGCHWCAAHSRSIGPFRVRALRRLRRWRRSNLRWPRIGARLATSVNRSPARLFFGPLPSDRPGSSRRKRAR